MSAVLKEEELYFAEWDPGRKKSWSFLRRALLFLFAFPPMTFVGVILIYGVFTGEIFLMAPREVGLAAVIVAIASVVVCWGMFVLFELGILRFEPMEEDGQELNE